MLALAAGSTHLEGAGGWGGAHQRGHHLIVLPSHNLAARLLESHRRVVACGRRVQGGRQVRCGACGQAVAGGGR